MNNEISVLSDNKFLRSHAFGGVDFDEIHACGEGFAVDLQHFSVNILVEDELSGAVHDANLGECARSGNVNLVCGLRIGNG